MASQPRENEGPTSNANNDTREALAYYTIPTDSEGFKWKKVLAKRDPYSTIHGVCTTAYKTTLAAQAARDKDDCSPDSREKIEQEIALLSDSVLNQLVPSARASNKAALSMATSLVARHTKNLEKRVRVTLGDIRDTTDIGPILRREMTSRIITQPERPRKEHCLDDEIRKPTLTRLRFWIGHPKRKHIHWLHGERYSGTSTVLWNAAYYEFSKKKLPRGVDAVATFSFGSPHGSHEPHEADVGPKLAASFVATIVCQWIRFYEDLKPSVAINARSLRDDKIWRNTEIRDLVETLIIDPHRHIMDKTSRSISFFVLLDDLHYCTSETRAYVLDTMAQTIQANLPIYYLIAARDDHASGVKAAFRGRQILRNATELNKVEPWPEERATDVTPRRSLSPGPKDLQRTPRPQTRGSTSALTVSSRPRSRSNGQSSRSEQIAAGAGTASPSAPLPSSLKDLSQSGKVPRGTANIRGAATHTRSGDRRSRHTVLTSTSESVHVPELRKATAPQPKHSKREQTAIHKTSTET